MGPTPVVGSGARGVVSRKDHQSSKVYRADQAAKNTVVELRILGVKTTEHYQLISLLFRSRGSV
eukprot:5624151-Pyramimonas_sp.AAC.1